MATIPARLILVLGVLTTFHQAIIFRFTVPIAYAVAGQHPVPPNFCPGEISLNAFISTTGYSQLDAMIPRNAVVQANPADINPFWTDVDLVAIHHQTAITIDKPWCGSELGGTHRDVWPWLPESMRFLKAPTLNRRATCREFGIHYLVARIYDPAWQDKQSWVWKLNPSWRMKNSAHWIADNNEDERCKEVTKEKGIADALDWERCSFGYRIASRVLAGS